MMSDFGGEDFLYWYQAAWSAISWIGLLRGAKRTGLTLTSLGATCFLRPLLAVWQVNCAKR
ncbi:hypothetical protein AN931_27655 [Mycobacterium intracellulare subsp. chimaera]|nr:MULTISPECIES: hypothetical protein [Mycobacterium]MBZ4572049.1 hypothetical protein [Mycobacterium avium subsp. hominissuis]KPN45065.1 hypothetical protein AN931_27655 [Mycobacterium intracellulare subsp. chimaera]KPN46834.1 hypothetical protein AN933_25505 [Mycobacterium intracellulare subsp. chimaera]MDM4140924.1 hypothetical protein [Mycobacterium sp. FLAC0960]WSE53544.1 hypothetical protein QGN31_11185 [Mycobacterium sp. 2-64]